MCCFTIHNQLNGEMEEAVALIKAKPKDHNFLPVITNHRQPIRKKIIEWGQLGPEQGFLEQHNNLEEERRRRYGSDVILQPEKSVLVDNQGASVTSSSPIHGGGVSMKQRKTCSSGNGSVIVNR